MWNYQMAQLRNAWKMHKRTLFKITTNEPLEQCCCRKNRIVFAFPILHKFKDPNNNDRVENNWKISPENWIFRRIPSCCFSFCMNNSGMSFNSLMDVGTFSCLLLFGPKVAGTFLLSSQLKWSISSPFICIWMESYLVDNKTLHYHIKQWALLEY